MDRTLSLGAGFDSRPERKRWYNMTFDNFSSTVLGWHMSEATYTIKPRHKAVDGCMDGNVEMWLYFFPYYCNRCLLQFPEGKQIHNMKWWKNGFGFDRFKMQFTRTKPQLHCETTTSMICSKLSVYAVFVFTLLGIMLNQLCELRPHNGSHDLH